MNARFFDMFHNAANIDLATVAQGINIYFDGIVQKPVNQHRIFSRHNNRVTHITFQIIHLVDNFHGSSTQYI